jgi:hypothetical protein
MWKCVRLLTFKNTSFAIFLILDCEKIWIFNMRSNEEHVGYVLVFLPIVEVAKSFIVTKKNCKLQNILKICCSLERNAQR